MTKILVNEIFGQNLQRIRIEHGMTQDFTVNVRDLLI